MPLFVIHRIHREDLPADESLEIPPMTGIKIFPLKDASGDFHTIDAHSGVAAFGVAKLLWPFLSHSLCVQPLTEYQNDLARFAAYKADRLAGVVPPRGKSSGVLHRPATSSKGD